MDTLEKTMQDALINNRVEFVDLLLEKGVSMRKFLTTDRLNNLFQAVTVSTTHDDVKTILDIRTSYKTILYINRFISLH